MLPVEAFRSEHLICLTRCVHEGGQPADTGMIRSKDKETFFKV